MPFPALLGSHFFSLFCPSLTSNNFLRTEKLTAKTGSHLETLRWYMLISTPDQPGSPISFSSFSIPYRLQPPGQNIFNLQWYVAQGPFSIYRILNFYLETIKAAWISRICLVSGQRCKERQNNRQLYQHAAKIMTINCSFSFLPLTVFIFCLRKVCVVCAYQENLVKGACMDDGKVCDRFVLSRNMKCQ